ncbi:MAG: 50S ribosomal protein L11 methyltransferase [Desulfatirhabdiaceae bacterium]
MKWLKACVLFDAPDLQMAEDFISGIFYDLGLGGVVVEDPLMTPAEGWGDGAVSRPEFHSVSGYFPCHDNLDRIKSRLETDVAELGRHLHMTCRIVYHDTDDEDWAESWKAYFWPLRLSDRLVVKPTWRDYSPESGDIVIEIDPGMAFGTGTHATTMLCARMIEKYVSSGKTVLDVGTGSGILMIAAARLGAKTVYGIDSDRTACQIACQNLRLNHISHDRFLVVAGQLIDCIVEKPDMIVANILTDVILALLNPLPGIMRTGGIFICSGIIESNTPKIIDRLQEQGFQILEESKQDSWSCIVSIYPSAKD